jgi:hypothetical protein
MYTNQVVNRSSPGIIDTSESKHHQHFNFNYNSIMPDAVNRLSTFLTFDDEKSKFAPLLGLLEFELWNEMYSLQYVSIRKVVFA